LVNYTDYSDIQINGQNEFGIYHSAIVERYDDKNRHDNRWDNRGDDHRDGRDNRGDDHRGGDHRR